MSFMKSALNNFLSLLIIASLLLTAGCAYTSPSYSAVQTETTSIMLTGVPDVRQAEYSSCGASSFQAVLSYYGIDSFETDLRTMLNTSSTHGTYSWDIVKVAQQMGLNAEWKENVTLNDIESFLRKGYPVITRSQRVKATNGTWEDTWTVGHYMVVIGLDDQNVYLEDPFLLGSRLKMTRGDFVASWHSYVSEVPIPPDAKKSYNEAVFIRGTPPAERLSYIGPLEMPAIVRPVIAQPPIVDPAHTTK